MNDSAQRPSAQDRRRERTPSSRPEQASDDGLPTGTDPPREAGNTNKGDPADAGPAESGNHAGQDGDTSSDVEEEENHGPTGLSDTDRIVVDHAGILNVYVEDRRAGGVYVSSGASVRSDHLAGRDARITRAGTDGETSVRMVSVSAVSAEELTRLRAVTVRVTCHEDAVAILKQDRFVLLSGPPGTGKRAGGVALFSDPQTILDIDPSVTLGSLFEFTARISQPGAHHYIIESLIPETARALNDFAARELTSQLTEADAYLVITVDNRVPLDRDVLCRTVAWHSRPEPVEALRRHLTFYLSATAAEEVLRQLPMVDLQPHLAEREMRLTDRLARRVSRAFQHGTGLEDAISSLGLGARRQVEEWFEHDPSISDVSFLLACAVLGGCAYTTVSAHATRIERLLADASRIDLTQLPQPMTRPRSQRLSAVMAKLGSGLVNTEFGASVTETVTLEFAPLVRAVLDVVWHEYDLVAEALLQWILAAGDDRDPDVRVRVAFAAGQLAEYDFTDIRSRLLLPWAKSEGVGPRGTAAFALGVPVATDTTASQVLGLLHHWATVTNAGLVWTATAAYGSYVGLTFPHIAMSELLRIVIHGKGQSAGVIRSVRRLFLLGGRQDPTIAPVILAGLVDWLHRDLAPAPQVARTIFVGLLATAGSAQQWDARAVYEQLTGEPSQAHAAVLLAHCLEHKDSQTRTLAALRQLLTIADTDEDVYDALQGLVVAAVATDPPSPRALQRLAHYLDRWQAGSRTSPSVGRLLTGIRKEMKREDV